MRLAMDSMELLIDLNMHHPNQIYHHPYLILNCDVLLRTHQICYLHFLVTLLQGEYWNLLCYFDQVDTYYYIPNNKLYYCFLNKSNEKTQHLYQQYLIDWKY